VQLGHTRLLSGRVNAAPVINARERAIVPTPLLLQWGHTYMNGRQMLIEVSQLKACGPGFDAPRGQKGDA